MRGAWRSRWASLGACVVVAIGGGGLLTSDAAGVESSFVAVTPTRVLDTRTNLGLTGKFVSDTARLLTVTGTIPTASGTMQVVPSGAVAVVMNVTIVGPSAGGFASVRPGDAVGAPATSNLNFGAGAVIPNAVTVALPPAGNLNLYYFGSTGSTTDMLIDIVGYYVAGSSGPPGPDGANGIDAPRGPSLGRENIFSTNVVDAVANTGSNPSIAIGIDGLPIIAHTDLTNNALRVTHCNDLACATVTNATADTGDTAGDDVGFEPSIAIGVDGFPIIAHRDGTESDSELRVTHCSNLVCSVATSFTVDPNNDVGHNPAIAIGADGLPIIAYSEFTTSTLKVSKCLNLECTSVTTTVVDEDNNVGLSPSIAIGADGLAIIAHTDLTTDDLRVTHCSNVACTADTSTSVETSGVSGGDPAIAIGTDGLAIIAHVDGTLGLRAAHCDNVACTSATNTVLSSTTGIAVEPSITIGLNGFAVIAHRAPGVNDLWITFCGNVGCTTATSKVLDTTGSVGNSPSITIGSDSHLVIAQQAIGANDLRITKVLHMAWTPNAWES